MDFIIDYFPILLFAAPFIILIIYISIISPIVDFFSENSYKRKELQQKNEELEVNLDHCEQIISEDKENIQSYLDEIKKLEILNTNQKNTIEDLKEKNSWILSENDQLITANTTLSQDNIMLSGENNLLKSELEELTSRWDTIKEYQNIIDSSCTKLLDMSNSNYNMDSLFNGILEKRLENAFATDLQIKNLKVSADIQSTNDLYDNVTLNDCPYCRDQGAEKNGFACKHRLFLAYTIGILQLNKEKTKGMIGENVGKLSNLSKQNKDLEHEITDKKKKFNDLLKSQNKEWETAVAEQKAKLDNLRLIRNQWLDEINTIAQQTSADYPHLAAVIADYKSYYFEKAAHALETKKRPAHAEALRIKDLKQDYQKVLAQKKELEYKLSYIESMFPNINDIFDSGFTEEQSSFALETKDTTDPVRNYLSEEEYHSLSRTEKNQLALNKYIEGRKSNWQIGRDYEMYIGYHCEKMGYRVTYTGIIKNLEDMGRDLIAKKNDQTYIIQCKRWSKEKTIHEKHIFQLFGTVVLYNLENPNIPALGVFVSTTQLSEKAQQIAKELNIKVIIMEPGEFPRIKCNVNRTTGEKIYHLPFDQQYDTVVIDEFEGECYAFTVREAESKGFRRAFKHSVL